LRPSSHSSSQCTLPDFYDSGVNLEKAYRLFSMAAFYLKH